MAEWCVVSQNDSVSWSLMEGERADVGIQKFQGAFMGISKAQPKGKRKGRVRNEDEDGFESVAG